MSPFPTPSALLDSASEAFDKIHELYDAWEAAGGDEEMTMGSLVALGAVTGIDEAALATAGAITVGAYIAKCLGCVVSAAGSSIWDLLSSNDLPDLLRQQVVAEAEKQGLSNPDAVA